MVSLVRSVWRGGAGKIAAEVLSFGQAPVRVGRLVPAASRVRPAQWPALCGTARAATRLLSSRAQVINPKTENASAERDVPGRSPDTLGGGSGGGCGSAATGSAPAMSSKMEQKAIEELDDMSIIEEVRIEHLLEHACK